MTYEEAVRLILEHTDYGGSLDLHALANALSTAPTTGSAPPRPSFEDELIELCTIDAAPTQGADARPVVITEILHNWSLQYNVFLASDAWEDLKQKLKGAI